MVVDEPTMRLRFRSGALADFEEMTVWVPEKGAYLAAVIDRVGEEGGTSVRKHGERLHAVGNLDREAGTHAVGVRRNERDSRLVICWPATSHQEEPCAGELEHC